MDANRALGKVEHTLTSFREGLWSFGHDQKFTPYTYLAKSCVTKIRLIASEHISIANCFYLFTKIRQIRSDTNLAYVNILRR